MEKGLNDVIDKDCADRERGTKRLDNELLVVLYVACKKGVSNPAEVPCVLRRFLTIRYQMTIEDIDVKLEASGLIESSNRGVLV